MIINNNIKILIFYKIQNNDKWFEVNIEPNDYFDVKYCDDDEEIEIDSIPVFNHAIDYIDIKQKEKISQTKILICDINSDKQIAIKETLWNNQKNNIIERIYLGDSQDYHLLIVTTVVSQNPTIYQIIRLIKTDDIFKVEDHCFITKNDDGTESEESIVLYN